MWLPASIVPSWIARDASSRHLAARLACSVAAFGLVALLPHAPEALATASGSRCLAQAWLGWPCPGCGITTSLLALGRGDLAAAMRANPAGLAVAAVLVGQGLLSAVGLWLRDAPAPAIHVWLGRLDRILLGSLGAAWTARILATWLSIG
jgi:hypothetical protein